MHVLITDCSGVNRWVHKAREQGWKRPRQIVELAEQLHLSLPSCFGYCEVCHRAVADFDILETAKRATEREDQFLARFEGGREGFINCDEVICLECMPGIEMEE